MAASVSFAPLARAGGGSSAMGLRHKPHIWDEQLMASFRNDTAHFTYYFRLPKGTHGKDGDIMYMANAIDDRGAWYQIGIAKDANITTYTGKIEKQKGWSMFTETWSPSNGDTNVERVSFNPEYSSAGTTDEIELHYAVIPHVGVLGFVEDLASGTMLTLTAFDHATTFIGTEHALNAAGYQTGLMVEKHLHNQDTFGFQKVTFYPGNQKRSVYCDTSLGMQQRKFIGLFQEREGVESAGTYYLEWEVGNVDFTIGNNEGIVSFQGTQY